MRIQLLALDLEATLVDDAMSANPRPGLFEFLEFCDENFERVALLTTVDEETAREVLEQLADSRDVPNPFVTRVEYIDWEGEYKDLRFAKDTAVNEVLFVDDDRGWVHPDQLDQWVSISAWHGGADSELDRVRSVLEKRIAVIP